jgi:hypothetical protein
VLTKISNVSLTLLVYGIKDTTKADDIAKNFYLEEDYQVAYALKDKLSAPYIRQEVEKMLNDSKDVYSKVGHEMVMISEE